MAENVAAWPLRRRLQETLSRTLPKLGPEARVQLEAVINLTALGIMVGVIVAWLVSHAYGLGEIIDIVLLVVGVAAIGLSVFVGLDHLFRFASVVYEAKAERDLDAAAEELPQAISILGIQVVLAILFRGRPSTKRVEVEPPPPRTPVLRYKPTVKFDPAAPRGSSVTSSWGDITVSARGSATDQAVVLFHEQVHRYFMPKLYVLRNFRGASHARSYVQSSLWRYIEEATAETIAQCKVVEGFRRFFVVVRFPTKSAYLYLVRSASDPYFECWEGKGLIPEGAGLLVNGMVTGIAFKLWYRPGIPGPPAASR